jgi:hypothetical protein
MNVIYGLSGTRIHIEYSAISLLMDIRLHGQFLGNLKHLADKRVIFRHQIVQRGYMFPWSNQ